MVPLTLLFSFIVVLFILTNWFWTILALIGLAIAFYGFLSAENNIEQAKKATDRVSKRLHGIKDFTVNQALHSPSSDSGIALDEKRKTVCIFNSGPPFRHKIYDFSDILAVEVVEDGHTTIKTERSSQIGGAIVGGLLLGGVGAVVGGLSGNKSSKTITRRIDLRITINNVQRPVHDIIMFMQAEDSNLDPTSARNLTRHWNGVLSVIIKRSAQEADKISAAELDVAKTTNVTQPNVIPISIADELKKLADLKSGRHLTEAEYEQQKARLLNS